MYSLPQSPITPSFTEPLRYFLTFIMGLSQARTCIPNVICHGSFLCSVNDGVIGDCGRLYIFNFLFGKEIVMDI
jgi:hypothetical protein